jgi:hypothetical protein
MIALIRIEVWRDGEFLHSRAVPNANVARVFMDRMKGAGYKTLLVSPRTETERAA